MISFYPGPSKLFPEVKSFLNDAFDSGILSVNHRSEEFVSISRKAITGLREKLQIPDDYTVYFITSATEAWEIISQSFVKKSSTHIWNGAFGEKWCEYAGKLKASSSYKFEADDIVTIHSVKIADPEMICFTHNETSNGTQIGQETLTEFRKKYPDSLIAVDATSSLAGVNISFRDADIWFASVQKCFGLPAGLGLLICSPAAVKRGEEINERMHYNSFLFMHEKMKDWQTTYTPNVLNIYLLSRLTEIMPAIADTASAIKQRADLIYNSLQSGMNFKPLINNQQQRSATVVAMHGEVGAISEIKSSAKKNGFLLGNGYGQWAKNTFRIANFPAISDNEIEALIDFLIKR